MVCSRTRTDDRSIRVSCVCPLRELRIRVNRDPTLIALTLLFCYIDFGCELHGHVIQFIRILEPR